MSGELLPLAEAWGAAGFAELSSLAWKEIAAAGAVVVTLAGVWLCWGAPRYRMSIEERAKDGLYTEDEARRKIRFMAWFGPAVTITGCLLLGVVILR